MNTLPKTFHLIKIGQPVPNFSVQLSNTFKTDFDSFREKKWTVLFTHPEKFIPKNRNSFVSFLEMQNFLTEHNAKLLGLNPEHTSMTDDQNSESKFGENSKIIIADTKGVVRSILVLNKMNYQLVKTVLKDIQIADAENTIRGWVGDTTINPIHIRKTDQQGFQPTDLFLQKLNEN